MVCSSCWCCFIVINIWLINMCVLVNTVRTSVLLPMQTQKDFLVTWKLSWPHSSALKALSTEVTVSTGYTLAAIWSTNWKYRCRCTVVKRNVRSTCQVVNTTLTSSYMLNNSLNLDIRSSVHHPPLSALLSPLLLHASMRQFAGGCVRRYEWEEMYCSAARTSGPSCRAKQSILNTA